MTIIDRLRLSAEQGTPLQRLFVKEVTENRGVIISVIKYYQIPHPHDISQEILFQAWKSYHKFDGRSKFSTWIYKISVHVCISAIRRHNVAIRNMAIIPYEPVIMPQDTTEWPDELQRAFRRLSVDDQRFLRVYYSGVPVKELASACSSDGNALRVRAHRIIQKIRQ